MFKIFRHVSWLSDLHRVIRSDALLVPYRDAEAGAPVVDERDVPAEVPAGAAVDRPLRLAEVAELRRAAEVRRLERAHRQDGRVREQVPAAKSVNK